MLPFFRIVLGILAVFFALGGVWSVRRSAVGEQGPKQFSLFGAVALAFAGQAGVLQEYALGGLWIAASLTLFACWGYAHRRNRRV